jgi:proline iminopeptidase
LTADGLFCLDVGAGPPLVVVHGGPEFDHSYLRPELDRLAGSFRVVYYDQRGRGRSAGGVRPGDVSLRSEIEDMERVRSELGSESVAVLGHSWGGVLAMEYAVRHPERVSHVILMGTAPASAGDWRLLREAFVRNRPVADQEAMDALASTDAFARGDLEAEAAFYRIHFRMTLRRPDLLEALVARLLSNYTADGVLLARAIEHRLSDETSRSADWDLFPELRKLDVPTLVLHSEHDFIPVELAARIAQAVPGARLSVLPGCGHFTYLESPELVYEEVASFFGVG